MKIDIIMNLYYEPPKMLEDYIKHNKHLYIPMNCGNLSVPVKSEFAKKHIKFEDELQDNISHLNPKLNEMTSIYAYWKNLMNNPDYVGFNHYRRIFPQYSFEDISNYDGIVSTSIPMTFNKSFFTGKPYPEIEKTDIRGGYYICHVKEDWDKMESILRNNPIYNLYFDGWMKQDALTSPCNLFIMRKDLFNEYCKFIFPILFKLEGQIDLTGRSDYQGRALAFLSERLTSFFIYVKRKEGYNFKEVDTLYFEGFKPKDVDNRNTFTRWV